MENIFNKIALVCAVVLPFWNIPLIVKMVKRRSSADVSMAWAVGVWVCNILMFPSALMSQDTVWRTFNIINNILFSIVFFTILKYRKAS